MLITLPICYRAETDDGRRGWTPRLLFRSVEVEIGTVDPDVCPVSIDNLDFGSGSRFTALWHDDSNWIRESPTWDRGFGRTYAEKFDSHDVRHVGILLNGHAWRAHAKACEDIPAEESLAMATRWLGEGRPKRSRFGGQQHRYSTIDREVARLRQYLDGVKLIDGYVYRRIGVPFFRIDARGDASVTIDGGVGRWGGFRLDRADDLRWHLEAHCHRDARILCDLPTVRMPGAVDWDDENVSFKKAIKFAKEALGIEIDSASGSRREACVRLMNAIRATKEARAEARDRLCDEIDEFVSYLSDIRIQSKDAAIRAWEMSSVLRAAAARWRIRPLDIEPTADPFAP